MSDKLPMPDLEKTHLRLDVNALTKARLERMSARAKLSLNSYANALIEAAISKEPTTEEDLARANEIIRANIENRKQKKAAKGIR